MTYQLDLSPKGYMTQQLGDWRKEIADWMYKNMEGDFTCDWVNGLGEFGGEIVHVGIQDQLIADFYLYIVFDNEEDKVKFILRWK